MKGKIKKLITQTKGDLIYLKKGWFFFFLSNPRVYFLRLIKSTLWIGAIAAFLSIFYYYFELQEHKIPTIFHNLIGVVIGLVLVFRTNTAYDRWWEGVKMLNSISSNIAFFITKLNVSLKEEDLKNENVLKIQKEFKLLINDFKLYLVTEDEDLSRNIYNEILSSKFLVMKSLSILNKEEVLSDKNIMPLETTFKEIIKSFDDCKRIKNTPIPISYTLHIKISITSYILTLPFGLLHDMGTYSILIVMMVYYIIAGIEIISNEIENPFRGDPNDIPMDKFVSDTEKTIEFTSNIK